MSNAHTPGPWEIATSRRGVERVYAGDSEIVRALSEHGSRRLPKAERDANRRVIATAPAMLAFVANVEAAISENGAEANLDNILAEARALLAAAKGESR
jgi:hypothetical protein